MSEANDTSVDIELLRQLADANGVSTSFWDWYGNKRNVSATSLLRVLEALGLNVHAESTTEDIQLALSATKDAPWLNTLPPTIVVREYTGGQVPVHVPHGDWVTVTYQLEDGRTGDLPQMDVWVEPRRIGDHLVGRATFALPDWFPPGYHYLHARTQDGTRCDSTLIVVPNRLNPPALQGPRRYWGAAVQLYSVRSNHDWGMGDALDLQDLTAICAAQGADFIQINPVHASSPVIPQENSPYLPVTRRWINPIFIRPQAILETARLSDEERARIGSWRKEVGHHDGQLIDRDAVWAAKLKALEIIYQVPRSISRQAQFEHFKKEGGSSLEHFTLWCALVEESGDVHDLQDCPTSESAGAQQARIRLADRTEFWAWCQWVVSTQFETAGKVARDLGMSIGVMADLAVGVHPYGSDMWDTPEMFATGMSVGAPPDMYSQQGQDWSQPPWSPAALERAGYVPLRDMVRAALRNAGALRIDHVLGLFRLWWIPKGLPASEGTYVSFNYEAMVGIVLLEAKRAGAVIIGEDLGTVEPWVRDYLHDRGILGTSILWFEKDESGWPKYPNQYRRGVLAAVNTHDLPPTAGYLEGVHTQLRSELGLLVDDLETVRHHDRQELERMNQRLGELGLLEVGEERPSEVIQALYAFIARTPSVLVAVSLVDAVGDRAPQNLPGTNREYPNWCVPLCDQDGHEVTIQHLADHPGLQSLFATLRENVN